MIDKNKFIQQLIETYPNLKNVNLDELVSENLISPFIVELPKTILEQAQQVIRTLFSLRQHPGYTEKYKTELESKGLNDPGNNSIFMSYDFHVNSNNQLKLIEINTNASFLALGAELYKAHNLKPFPQDFTTEKIKSDIETELQLNGKTKPSDLKIAIIDDSPKDQRLFVEFLTYAEMFKSWGWNAQILDYREINNESNFDFIYNRYTDFYLTDPSSQVIKSGFNNRTFCLSPNPCEYLLLADKQRLIDWGNSDFLNSLNISREDQNIISGALLKSFDFEHTKAEELWSLRKNLFFKPKNAFGSKQSYKGASISRKTFEELDKNETIAQEFVPAPEVEYVTPEGPQKFKYDLRCYAYQGNLELIVARLYQGQVTNLRTRYGGFAPVSFS